MNQDLILTLKAIQRHLEEYKPLREAERKNPNDKLVKAKITATLNNLIYANNKLLEKTLLADKSKVLRLAALEEAIANIGIMEASGHNDGIAIRKFQENISWLEGKAWCASFVSYCFKVAAEKEGIPRLFRHEPSVNKLAELAKEKGWYITKDPEPGDVFLILDSENWNKSHTGFVKEAKKDEIKTVEGNFKNQVYSRWLDKQRIAAYMRVTV